MQNDQSDHHRQHTAKSAKGIYTANGILLIPDGQQLSEAYIDKLRNHNRLNPIAQSLLVALSMVRQVAELVGQIAESTAREAQLAGGTADNIQHIFAVTEQTGEGTRSTVQQVRELTRIADELKQSVARFRIS